VGTRHEQIELEIEQLEACGFFVESPRIESSAKQAIIIRSCEDCGFVDLPTHC